jgi:spermidine synthase
MRGGPYRQPGGGAAGATIAGVEKASREQADLPPRALPASVAAALVFFTSAAVLVLEIVAARLLAPYVGLTLETYSAIIGVVLAGIALGTWLGGRAADVVDPRILIGPLMVAGGGLAILALPIVTFFGQPLRGGGSEGIVLFAMGGFFAPAAVLSAVAPTIVKLQLHDLRATGTVVGRLSAVGTAGAIAGTFLTGFVLLGAFATSAIVITLGIALIVVGIGCWLVIARAARRGLVLGGVLLGLAGLALGFALPSPCDTETAHYCVEIRPDPSRPSGRSLYLDGLRHSYVDLADPAHLEVRYTRAFAAVLDTVAPPPTPVDVLHIGGGGLTMPRYLAATRPGGTNRVLELDDQLIAIVERELAAGLAADASTRIGDARMTLAGEPAATYDLVIGDAFAGLALPWHLTTVEFAVEVRRVLQPGGIYVLNVIDHPPLGLARAEMATLRGVFGEIALIGSRGPVHGLGGGNVILVASQAAIPVARLRAEVERWQAGLLVIGDPAELDRLIDGAPVLRDDFAPVDQLMSRPGQHAGE